MVTWKYSYVSCSALLGTLCRKDICPSVTDIPHWFLEPGQEHVVVILAARLRKCKHFFCVCVCVCVLAKRQSLSQAFPAKTVETRNKNHHVSQRHALFCEDSLIGKIDVKDVEPFQNGLVHKFYHLQALITLAQVNTSVKTLMARL